MIDEEETISEPRRSRRRPATTPDAREKQLVSLAVDLAEKQLRAGTASAQVISHFLKLGSTREELEQERLRSENLLTRAKVQSIESQEKTEVLMREALEAMRNYTSSSFVKDTPDEA